MRLQPSPRTLVAAVAVPPVLALVAACGGGRAGGPSPAAASASSSASASGSARTPSVVARGNSRSSSGSAPTGAGASPGSSPGAGPGSGPAVGASELPRGGREVFPRYRLVGFSGAPGSAAFGRLGVGILDERVAEIEKVARSYRAGREALPVLELIAVVVQRYPGRDGLYRVPIGDDVIRRYLDAARRHKALLLLNIQPGRARFVDEVHALARWLREPDVGLALDPEWAVGPGQTPGRVFGSTTGAVIDEVSAYLDGIVRADGLPQKVLVVHQLNPGIVRGFEKVRERNGVAVVKSVDGIGSAGAKVSTWKRLVKNLPSALHPGFKLFFDEDTAGGLKLMTPSQVLALRPQPEYVLYE
jgi:hypothetical protein